VIDHGGDLGLAPLKSEGCRFFPDYPVLSNFMNGDYSVNLVSLKLEMNSLLDTMKKTPKERSVSRFLKGLFGNDTGF